MASVDLIVLKDRFSTSKTVKKSPEKNLRNRRNHFFYCHSKSIHFSSNL